MFRPWGAQARTILLILLLAVARRAAGQCQLPFRLDGAASTLEVTGSGALGASSLTIRPLNDQVIGVLGVMQLETVGECPEGPEEVAWAGAGLGTRPGEALRVYPSTIMADVPELGAAVNLTDLVMTWRSEGVDRLPGGGPADFVAAVNLTLVGGAAVYDAGILSGSQAVENFSAASDVEGRVGFGEGVRRLAVPEANFTFEIAIGPISLELELAGRIEGDLGVGCVQDCGPNGRCSPAGVGGDGPVACECDCGWGGGSCAVPTGFCPSQDAPVVTAALAGNLDQENPDEDGESDPDVGGGGAEGGDCFNGSSVGEVRDRLAVLLAGSNATVRAAELGDLCSGNCDGDERSRFDQVSGECVCADGWMGPGCDMCSTNSACNDFWDTVGGTCVTAFEYSAESTHKVYNCDFSDFAAGLQGSGIGLGDDLKITCNTTGPRLEKLAGAGLGVGTGGGLVSGGPDLDRRILDAQEAGLDANSPFCDVAFDFSQGGDLQTIQCRGWGCEFGSGSRNAECSGGVLCNCGMQPCSAAVLGIVNTIQSVVMVCEDGCEGTGCDDDTARRCNLDLGTLELSTVCTARECTDPGQEVNVGESVSTGRTISITAVISLLPVAAVIAVAILLGIPAQSLARQMVFQPKGASSQAPKKQSSALSEVVFIGVSCSVPVSKRFELPQPGAGGKPKEEDMESCSSQGVPFRRSSSQQSEVLMGLNATLAEKLFDKRGRRSVLHGITGTFQQGEVVGVMGPSGSGKTTFLSILSSFSRDEQRAVEGDIWVNGRQQGAWLKRLIAFVPQEDKILATLTVKEAIMVSAILRLPDADWAIIHRRTGEVMDELGLHGVAHSLVGGVRGMRGISGGERRRVTIGMELITDPAILILDEPTSGLDSFTALNLMQGLKVVGDAGRIVVASLHQPAPAIVALLDKVLLLARGFQVYFGPPGEAKAYFARLGLSCPESLAISEYMLQVVSDPNTLVTVLNSAFEAGARESGGDLVMGSKTANDPSSLAAFPKLGARRRFDRLATLVWRGMVDMMRNPALIRAHVAMGVAMGLFGGGIFFEAGLDVEGAQNRLGAFFFTLALLSFSSLTTIDLLHSERDIAFREIKAGFYTPEAYISSKLILDALLLRVVPGTLLAIPLHRMMGLQSNWTKFWIYLFTINSFNLIVGAMAMIVTIWSPTPGTTSLVMNTVLLMNLLFSGFLVQWSSIAPILRWIHYCCPFAYAFHSLVLNEFVGLKMTFAVAGYVSVDNIDGEVFLQTLGIEVGRLRQNEIVLAAFYFGFVAVALLSMRLGTPGQWSLGSSQGGAVGRRMSADLRRAREVLQRRVSRTVSRRVPIPDEGSSASVEMNKI